MACDNYRLDMNAAIFGACQCGFPKAEHAESAFGNTVNHAYIDAHCALCTGM